jgi:release factor glutamine methyltransferase
MTVATGAATIRALLLDAEHSLAGIDSARLDAEVLLGAVLQKPREWLHAHAEEMPPPSMTGDFQLLLSRRREGFPVAYLVGMREFWSMPIKVNRCTLIPRPETELLISMVLETSPRDEPLHALDLGTGSGAIALALARERPAWRITAADISVEALEVARENAARLAPGRVEFRQSDWLQDLGTHRFDLILCNPPYVAADDPAFTWGEIRFEPRLALDGGAGGLQALRIIIAASVRHVLPGGRLLLEHGATQGDAVRRLLLHAGYTEITTIADLAGLERVTAARLP